MSESTRAAAKAMGEVMVAFGDGADIEFRYRCYSHMDVPEYWHYVDEPNWDWEYCDFRVRKKEEKPNATQDSSF